MPMRGTISVSMSDNVLQSLQQLIQDVLAPDVRELKVRVAGIEKQLEMQFHMQQEQSAAQYKSILSAIAEAKAQSELQNVRTISALSERVAVLESLGRRQ
jgi:Mg2+ and Co2+ transporter CorA